jgi:uncharacterized metal-binding protein YceD (DUF177 family)
VEMTKLKGFYIQFSGLKLGEHQFDFEIDEKFFAEFGYEEFEKAALKADVLFVKKENQLELSFTLSGQVWLYCDYSNEPFWFPIKAESHLTVKFGNEFDDSLDEILVIPHGDHKVNIAQYLYETAVLAKPLKVVNPKVESSKMDFDAKKYLVNEVPEEVEEEEEKKENTDPRWDKLKDLLN